MTMKSHMSTYIKPILRVVTAVDVRWLQAVTPSVEIASVPFPLNPGRLCDSSDQQNMTKVTNYQLPNPGLQKQKVSTSYLLKFFINPALRNTSHGEASTSALINKLG